MENRERISPITRLIVLQDGANPTSIRCFIGARTNHSLIKQHNESFVNFSGNDISMLHRIIRFP